MKRIRTSVAILLLVSTALSACSREESVQTEPSETTFVTETVSDREYLIDQVPDTTYDESYEEDLWSAPVVPTDAFEFVIDSILDHIDDPDADKGSYPYIGWTEDSGVDQFIEGGGTKDDLAAAYVDINSDGVSELVIVALNDPLGYSILEMYSYDSSLGIHPVLHGNSERKYYLTSYYCVSCLCTEPGCEFIGEFWIDWDMTMFLSSAYYIVDIAGVDHLCETWSDEYLLSNNISSPAVYDYGPLHEQWNEDAYASAFSDYFSDLYTYDDLTRLSDWRV